ncbi:MAG: ABC transporter substrate-binding protein [Chromatiaceae bacterium]|jgi:trehalose/maltose transport system substrate-binding protein
MRPFFMALAALAISANLPGPASAETTTITISCGAVGAELALCREGAERWAAETGHAVEVVSTPNSSTERLALYQQLLAAGAGDIDVFQIDVIWPGMLASHLVDLRPLIGDSAEQHYPAMVRNNTVGDRLVAMPWFASVGVLYYRQDLLAAHGVAVPDSWPALTEAATRIQDTERASGNGGMWGYVWQGRAYEGLTCNALEWVASAGGGTVVDRDGQVTVNNPRAVAAVDQAAAWVDRISPPGILNYAEEEARGVFQSGNAVFMRNWPYAWALAQSADSPVRGRVGVAPLPGGVLGDSAATLGGWQLAVSRYSEHPTIAADLVRYLTSAQEQKRRAIAASLNPTIPALYADPDVLAAAPFFADLQDIMRQAVARPSSVTGSRYNQVSNAFWSAVHRVLSGKQPAAQSLAALERRLNRLSRGGRRW